MLNIDKLHKEILDREKKKTATYEKILELCYRRIVITNKKTNDCCCFFSCPSFYYGVPLYNMINCTIYIMEQLISNGFQVQYSHPNILYISWKVNKKSGSEINKEQKKLEYNQFRDIMDINSKELIYHPTDIMNISNLTNDLFTADRF